MSLADLLLYIVLIAPLATSAASYSVHGCGGFVEASSSLNKERKASDKKLDYSHITVELQTVDGLVKERTQCAPNGYYFIPVYDKGSFVVKVKGPDGWSWQPDAVPVIVDENGCNSNADINFQFTGFLISGKVKGAVGGESCFAKTGGPANVTVELMSSFGDLVSSVVTSDLGIFSFTNVTPGIYGLHASHSNMEIKTQGSSEVALGFGNVRVDDIFLATGYTVHGFVEAQGNPILGVHIYLYSEDVLEVPCPQGLGNAPGQDNALCHAISDVDGKFSFDSIPCGIYQLIPYYKGENTVFDVSPPSIMISVGHRDTMVDKTFQVTGFSIGGRVIDSYGAGVEDVDILLDGNQRAVTDKHGYYKLDQVTSSKYRIGAQKRHYKFNILESFLVLPNMAAIPDIEAISYDLCGVIHFVDESHRAKVALTHGPENMKPQVKIIDDGDFCFEVLPGDYRLSAFSAHVEDSAKLLFSPPHVDVTVKSPVLNIEFSQAQVNISGTVQCKEKCSSSVSVALTRLVRKDAEERKAISLGNEDGTFMFTKVVPGNYRLQVKHACSAANFEDGWCWEKNTVELDVGTENKDGINFIQKGFWFNIISTHDVNVSVRQPDSPQNLLQIKRGSQRICLESPGLHELQFVDSCVLFDTQTMTFNASNSSAHPLYLTGEKYLLRGKIYIEFNENYDNFDLSKYVAVDILNKDFKVVDTVRTLFIHSESASASGFVLEYSAWAAFGETMIFVPHDTRVNEEKKILFYPRMLEVAVSTDDCQYPISPIFGRVGVYIEGSVTPAVSDVNIKIFAAKNNANVPLQMGELALEGRTETDGNFRAGPLYDDATYYVEASKPGYYLKAIGSNSFLCQMLSQISVRVYSGETGELLPSVFLSLSGDGGYRNNTITGADGLFLFNDLFPGNFYLRPLLKEYTFDPITQSIELGPGEYKEVIFHSTRVAYSVFGTVSLLSGQPKEGVYLEARSESKGYHEETASDSFGRYRLRGLIPNTTYVIRLGSKEHLLSVGIERTSPENLAVEVGTIDIMGVDFIVFELPEITIMSGHVEGNDLKKLQPHLSLEVKLASNPSKIISATPLPLSCYFQLRDLPKEKLLVQLASNLPSASYTFRSEVLEVDLALNSQKHVGPLGYKIEEYHRKQEITPAPLFPLVACIAVTALFISMPRLKDLLQPSLGAFPHNSVTTASSKKEAKKPLPRRKV